MVDRGSNTNEGGSMKFYEALKEVLENGKKIKRSTWSTLDFVYYDNFLANGRTGNPYEPSLTALVSDDWEIVKEKVKKSRTVWINCYKESTGAVYDTPEAAAARQKMSDFLFAKEVTYEWEEEE
jgi:hypothetical protein